MRVSKVKVDNKMVLMHRKTAKGALIFEKKVDDDKTSEIILHKKKKSFDLSILNKTIVAEKGLKRLQLDKKTYFTIRNIFQKKQLPQEIEKEKIPAYLNHRFQVKMKYLDGNKPIEFYLPDLIYEAVKEQSFNKLEPYSKWKDWYIKNKGSKLIKSIDNNRINIDQTTSKRKRVLQNWANDYTSTGNIDLSWFHTTYKTDQLVTALNLVDKKSLTDTGVPKEINAYCRALKVCLQEHQKAIFGTREAPNHINRNNEQMAIYNLEIVKYLEHYFPIKSSSRKISKENIQYYLDENTIKATIHKQLLNSVRNSLIQQGKSQYHNFNNSTTSETLSDIKRNEAFVLNLINACAFATNNIRNIIDRSQTEDILYKSNFIASINKSLANSNLFKLFYNTDLPTAEPDKTNALWAIRGAVQQIRNQVVHYKQDALSTIFNITEAEIPTGKVNYSFTIYKKCLENDIDKLPETIALQLKTGSVLTYYKQEDLKSLFEKFPFTLSRSLVPFAPGFKNVMSQGINYQNAGKGKAEEFYDLEIKHYTEKNKPDKEAYDARYYLLKLIYNNLFLSYFTTNKEVFSKSVQFVLNKNKKHAQNSGNKFAYAFAGIRPVNENEKIPDYMAYVQSNLNLEQNKKEDEKEDEKHINFQNFIKQVFIKGFDSYLNDEKFIFIGFPVNQLNVEHTNSAKADKLNLLEKQVKDLFVINADKINANDPSHIAFYTFCKLLDANYLSTLRNELTKFISAGADEKTYSHLPEIIELCLIKADQVPANYQDIYTNETESLDLTRKFIEPGAAIENWDDLFVQSDKTTSVIHAGIELSRKYGTLNLLEEIINKDSGYKIKKPDFLKWHSYQEQLAIPGNQKGETQTLIAEKTIQREVLHKEWEKLSQDYKEIKSGKEYKAEEKQKAKAFLDNFIKTKGNDYLQLCKEIDEYNWLDNKLHFIHLKRLHQLTIDLLGRMAGFVALWERDFQFISGYIETSKGAVSLNFSHGIPKANKFDENYYKQIFLSNDYRDIRNYIAHFNYLCADELNYTLIDLINKLRDLLSYDRKQKNVITKSIFKLFDKHGMELVLKFNFATHKIEIDKLQPKKLKHLGTKTIETNQVSEEYCRMCKTLLELKK